MGVICVTQELANFEIKLRITIIAFSLCHKCII